MSCSCGMSDARRSSGRHHSYSISLILIEFVDNVYLGYLNIEMVVSNLRYLIKLAG